VNNWFVVGSAAVVAAVCLALLAGKDDIRRFWQIHNMYEALLTRTMAAHPGCAAIGVTSDPDARSRA